MKTIFEPNDLNRAGIGDRPKSEVEPNVEITEGLRLHFHREGVTFGMVDPNDTRFAVVIDYERARRMMFAAAGVRYCEELETKPFVNVKLILTDDNETIDSLLADLYQYVGSPLFQAQRLSILKPDCVAARQASAPSTSWPKGNRRNESRFACTV